MWFAAKLQFDSVVANTSGRVLQEESIRLIQAADEAEALSRANAFGAANQQQYLNDEGELVTWTFVSVLEIQDLCEDSLYDGMEVFSTLKWSEPPAGASE